MSKMKCLVLGYGLQGKATVFDLLKDDTFSKITVVDSRASSQSEIDSLNDTRVSGMVLDIADEASLLEVMKEHDVVISLLPRNLTFGLGKMAVEANSHYVGVSYFEDPEETDQDKIAARRAELKELDRISKEKGLVLLTEWGMDPGLDLLLCAQAVRELDEVENLTSYGAGFPELKDANNPLQYKFTYNILGTIRSYFRPAKVIRNGELVTIPQDELFSEKNIHELNIDELGGTLQAFPNGDSGKYAKKLNIDGTIKNMGRYVCRWKGHCEFWYIMAKCGFLSREPINVNGASVIPSEFVASLLGSQNKFHYQENEKDVAYVAVHASGKKDGKQATAGYRIIDKRDANGFTAMQRTVGMVASIGAQMIAKGIVKEKGLITAIQLPFEETVEELAKRNIVVTKY